MEFRPMPKMARLSREVIVTEKLDGTNASVYIAPDSDGLDDHSVGYVDGLRILAGSRTRWVTPQDDNFGWAAWVRENAEELVKLGPGHHFGEWWGRGIQRGYGLAERRFSLFNVGRWVDQRAPRAREGQEPLEPYSLAPLCCHVVPTLYRGEFGDFGIKWCLDRLVAAGSFAAPGFMDPEGVVVFHTAAGTCFKKTIKGDEAGKSHEGQVKKERPARAPRDPSTGGRRKPVTGFVYAGPFRRSTDPK